MTEEQEKYFKFLIEECKYKDVKFINDSEWVAIAPYIFTHGILKGNINDFVGYSNRWCYHTYEAAKKAIDEWSGEGEPDGWHKNPMTGRRRYTNAEDEIIEEIRR